MPFAPPQAEGQPSPAGLLFYQHPSLLVGNDQDNSSCSKLETQEDVADPVVSFEKLAQAPKYVLSEK